jgi:hypothetical protein
MNKDAADQELHHLLLQAFPAPERRDRGDWERVLRLANARPRLVPTIPAFHRKPRSRKLVLALATFVVVGAGAAVAAATGNLNGGPGQLSPGVGSVPVIEGSASDVLSTLASRLPLVSNPSTVSETVPPSSDPDATGSAVSGLAVRCDLLVDGTQGSAISQALWERDLFMGAVRDEFAARGFGTVIDGDATLVTPNGTQEDAGGGVSIGVRTDQVFDAIPSDIASTISANASSIGLSSVQVKTMQVLQDVLVINAVSDSPATDVAALQKQGGLQFLLGQPPMNFEGVYLQIDDNSGNPVYITDTAPRDGGGSVWADPSLGLNQGFLTSPSPQK